MTDKIARAAEEIREGRRSLTQIAPIQERLDLRTLDDANAVQRINTEFWLAAGRRAVGYKIGLTSAAVQAQLGVDQPDFGTLWADYAFGQNDEVQAFRFMQPRVEAEVAFVLGRDLDDPKLQMTTLAAAIDQVLPAVEIVDTVVKNWKISLVDTVADNASGGGYVLGNSPRRLDGLDLRLAGAVLSIDGRSRSIGVGAACMGDPLNAALWLCRKMSALGQPLRAGDLILSGALGPMVEVRAGMTVTAEIQGFSTLNFYIGV
ncbi:UNVERIFIED_ORG: 2-keto-4-pentenoate hydratase [Xanthobacter viscosus]|uniref:2-keto-4-pentenoate hydratase n=1 Tax=Xanthobacter autotrophicus TaxID=280 RepID=A0A6C1KAN2_XANAU|nr:fumarylacetoacetate hydrolase family protein [Xanthobacter autotrophicus]TLX41369.1 2-keto-4-pentenoate hydratase [Xanthobacter autotrophicus]